MRKSKYEALKPLLYVTYVLNRRNKDCKMRKRRNESVAGISVVVLIESLCRYTMKKLARENPKQSPCKI
jgi:hypothetical protein